jgi:hypothetical protein
MLISRNVVVLVPGRPSSSQLTVVVLHVIVDVSAAVLLFDSRSGPVLGTPLQQASSPSTNHLSS